MLHTHLAETMDKEEFCISVYGTRPVELMEDTRWIGYMVRPWEYISTMMN
ncbi:MAG: hypothetical protein LBV03_02485 [Fusobacteriales bacterium]|jgi:cytosine/adenosine deaminase-related metal-dependent hydrolase|nr:hypothetical protein [Fusobacteriales bacterium]